MKAVLYERYGNPEVLEFREIAKPMPKADEVLIRIHATSVTAGDWRMRKAKPFLVRLINGLFKPKRVKILGFELAGVIEETGEAVKTFQKGDEVFAFCGFRFGAYADYKCLPESGVIARKPSNMTLEQAATVPLGSLTALSLLRKGGIKANQSVLIYGASGSVGTFAIQLAKHFGTRVTAVCSGANSAMVRSIGADETIDYTKEDFTAVATRFDLVFDAVGKIKKSMCKGLLGPKGQYVSVTSQAAFRKADLWFVKDLIEAGELTTVIDRTYRIAEIREAHYYVEQFRKRGNVAIKIR